MASQVSSHLAINNTPQANDLQTKILPTLETVQDVLALSKGSPKAPNIVPLCASMPADLLTPSLAYLKISAKFDHRTLFLLLF